MAFWSICTAVFYPNEDSSFDSIVFDPKLLLLNIRSLNIYKANELSLECSNFKDMYFLCLTETWSHCEQGNQWNSTDNHHIEGYSLVTCFSRNVGEGGGVAIFSRNSIRCKRIDTDKYCVDHHIEVCALSCKLSNYNVIILTCYLSPTGDTQIFFDNLNDILSDLYNPSFYFILCGDFNFDYLSLSVNFQKLNNLVTGFGLSHVGGWPTRVADHSISSIDQIFASFVDKGVVYSCENNLSDYSTIFYDFSLGSFDKGKKICYFKRNYNDSALSNFSNALSCENWHNLYTLIDLDTAFTFFTNIFSYHFNNYFPLHKKYVEVTPRKSSKV